MNDAADKYFIGNAQLLRKLEVMEKALENNTKDIVPNRSDLVNVMGEMAGILPVKERAKKVTSSNGK